ncbi:hypothetical protein, partial [Streptomyces sp. NPDC048332]|uniref:hypothetical protein n=1 Tax=Streptomyces sp. NPDC048332 TaxID=3154619 RepID=UPI00342F8CCF
LPKSGLREHLMWNFPDANKIGLKGTGQFKRTDPGTRRRRLLVARECAVNAERDPWRPHRSTAV